MEKKQKHKIRLEDIPSLVFDLQEYGINARTRELFLHSHINTEFGVEFTGTDSELGVDFRMAAGFIKNLRLLDYQSDSNILIHQICCGGDWNYGMAIYNAIVTASAPITILAYAHARSMSSVILQAADLRILMPDCEFLVHHGTWEIADRAVPVLSNIEQCKKDMARMLDIYARRCKKGKFFIREKMTKKEIAEYIDAKLQKKGDWILSASEAVDYGLADGILGQRGFENINKIRKEK